MPPRLPWLACYGPALLLAACAQGPTKPPPAPPPPAPAVVEVPEPQPMQPSPPLPVSAAGQQQAGKIALAAAGLLESGQEEQAKAELQRALAADPGNKLAQNLLRQINADPVAVLGRESFAYTVRPNDTMSAIAGRFLGDIYAFYILARYNNISVPRQLAGGQVLRIPGKAPPPAPPAPAPVAAPPVPPPAPAPIVVPAEPSAGELAMKAAEAAERSGNQQRAYAEYSRAAGLGQPGAEAKAEQLRKQLVQRLSLNARTAFAKQDLDGAIRAWEQVLSLDPGNDTAKLERQRALALKEKVKKL